MKIVIALPHRFSLWQAPPWFIERLKSQFPQLFFAEVKDYMGLPVQLKDADVFVGWSLRPEQLSLAPKLLWVHSPAAAVHQQHGYRLPAAEEETLIARVAQTLNSDPVMRARIIASMDEILNREF